MAEFLEESLGRQFLMTSLIIGYYLVRFHLPGLECHAVRHVLVVEVLAVTYKVAEEQFRTGIHHLVHIRGAGYPSLLTFVVRTVVEVYLRTIGVPQRVRHGRKNCIEGRHILVLEFPFAIYCGIPPHHHRRIVQIRVHRGRTLDGLQSAKHRLTVVFIE